MIKINFLDPFEITYVGFFINRLLFFWMPHEYCFSIFTEKAIFSPLQMPNVLGFLIHAHLFVL
jgi:hypothetical protein